MNKNRCNACGGIISEYDTTCPLCGTKTGIFVPRSDETNIDTRKIKMYARLITFVIIIIIVTSYYFVFCPTSEEAAHNIENTYKIINTNPWDVKYGYYESDDGTYYFCDNESWYCNYYLEDIDLEYWMLTPAPNKAKLRYLGETFEEALDNGFYGKEFDW